MNTLQIFTYLMSTTLPDALGWGSIPGKRHSIYKHGGLRKVDPLRELLVT